MECEANFRNTGYNVLWEPYNLAISKKNTKSYSGLLKRLAPVKSDV